MKAILYKTTPDVKPVFPGLYREVGSDTVVLFQTREYGVIVRCNNQRCLGNAQSPYSDKYLMLPVGTQVVLENE